MVVCPFNLKWYICNVNFVCFIAVMEVAIGEHDIDLTKMMGTALKKYYEERDAHSIGLVAADNIIRHADDGRFFVRFQFLFCFGRMW